MTTANIDEYSNPYGDLHGHKREPRPQHTSFVYDGERVGDDESRGLINAPPTTAKTEEESDLAMAIVDILSCCDGSMNPNQAKLLRDMENRYQEKGNLITGQEDKQEEFEDEFDDSASFIKKVTASIFRPRPPEVKNDYVTRSSSFILELPVIEDPPTKAKTDKRARWKYGFCLGAVTLILFVAIVYLVKLNGLAMIFGHSSSVGPMKARDTDSDVSPYTSDCVLASKQENPSPLSQCACGGSIDKVSDKAKEKYDKLLYAFGAEYLHQNETMNSCSARNQALVWLSEDPGSTLSEVLIQRHSLVIFFLKTHGIHWTLENHQKWLTPSHECTWFGIVCNAEKQVTAIELWNLGLTGSIPKEIMSLTNLERLSLPENSIGGHLPVDAFAMMSKLTDLTLFLNSLTGAIDPRIFDAVTQLKTLNLDSNALTGPIPTKVGKLTGLTQLKLARNNLNGLLPTELGNLKRLKAIELEENNLYGLLPPQLGGLTELESLDLSWNNFQGPIPLEYKAFANLKDLFLKSNDLGGTLPAIIDSMGKLENLVLSLNAFSGTLPSETGLMSSLTTLHLDENKFEGSLPSEVGSCSYLRDIRLNNNNFNGPIPSEIGQLAWLISLNLEGNSFSGRMPNEVCKLRGAVGTLETLTATCAAETKTEREKAVFGSTDELLCRVPDCCSSCSPKR